MKVAIIVGTGDFPLYIIDQIKDIKVLVKKAEGVKCPRCWKILSKQCDRCESVK